MDGPNQYRYEITLRIYRDCRDPKNPLFDDPAYLGLFLIGPDRNLTFREEIAVSPGTISTFNYKNNPCLITGDNICIEETTYIFEKVFNLISQDYFITYQRCCRNGSNIVSPEKTGITFSLTISPSSISSQNSSPKFFQFNEYVICQEVPYFIDFSAKDPDGDSLVYSFCTPFAGGGLGFSEENDTVMYQCDGLTPRPSFCIPELVPVRYRTSPLPFFPSYSVKKPIWGNPVLDSKTGFLTGGPKSPEIRSVGEVHLISVCVSEYRNSQLLSTISKEFEFYNVSCFDPQAKIRPTYLDGEIPTVLNCTNNPFNLVNHSEPEEDIFAYDWNIINRNNKYHFEDRNPLIEINLDQPSDTFYTQLIINGGTICADSVEMVFVRHPELIADFAVDFDSCQVAPIHFNSLSGSIYPITIKEYIWKSVWENGFTNIGTGPQLEYAFKDWKEYEICHIVEDVNRCRDTINKPLSYFPVPDTLMGYDSLVGCGEVTYDYNGLKKIKFSDAYQFEWNYMDGSHSNEMNVSHVYNQPGEFDVNITITSPNGCQYAQNVANIRVLPDRNYAIECSAQEISLDDPKGRFWSQFEDGDHKQWIVDGIYQTDKDTFDHLFHGPGRYWIELEVWNGACTHRSRKEVVIFPEDLIFLPNIFTPNSDGSNDYYMGEGKLEFIQTYEMKIWDRWGQLLFFTADPNSGWDGNVSKNGKIAAPGVYVCQLVIKDVFDKTHIYHQTVTLVR